VYARQVADRELSFGVSGMLFRDGLVMFDRQTDTLWSQVDGKAIKGPLGGRALRIVPSMHATWKQWKTLYPRSRVLETPGIRSSAYEDYNRDPTRIGIRGRRLRDQRLPAKERIIGVRTPEAAVAFVERNVRAARLVEETVGSLPVVLVATSADQPIVSFSRRVAGRVLSFRLIDGAAAEVEDEDTGSRWSLADGRAVAGALKGARLDRVAAHPAFWFGWLGYFPGTALWERPARPR
jgi:hypothetical protein